MVATITAVSYLELVTRYPQAAGAALYTHKAFGVHPLTFLVALSRLRRQVALRRHGGALPRVLRDGGVRGLDEEGGRR